MMIGLLLLLDAEDAIYRVVRLQVLLTQGAELLLVVLLLILVVLQSYIAGLLVMVLNARLDAAHHRLVQLLVVVAGGQCWALAGSLEVRYSRQQVASD